MLIARAEESRLSLLFLLFEVGLKFILSAELDFASLTTALFIPLVLKQKVVSIQVQVQRVIEFLTWEVLVMEQDFFLQEDLVYF